MPEIKNTYSKGQAWNEMVNTEKKREKMWIENNAYKCIIKKMKSAIILFLREYLRANE